ncbi:hypothetical protein Vafri_4495, partial [Volvox africanus]
HNADADTDSGRFHQPAAALSCGFIQFRFRKPHASNLSSPPCRMHVPTEKGSRYGRPHALSYNLGPARLLNKLRLLLLPHNVQSRVALTHSANIASNCKSTELVVVHAVGVQVPDVNLHAGVVLGRNELVGPRALARDVEVDNLALVVDHFDDLPKTSGGCVH